MTTNVQNLVVLHAGIDEVMLAHLHVVMFVLVVTPCVILLAKLNAKVLMGSLV